MKIAIKSVNVELDLDPCPDLSYLGRYSDTWEEGAIDRKPLGDMSRGSYRYFIPANSAEDTGNPNSPLEDYERMQKFNSGELAFYGLTVSVCLSVVRPKGALVFTRLKVSSGGLWGLESDSESSYFEEVALEQLEEIFPEVACLVLGVDSPEDLPKGEKIQALKAQLTLLVQEETKKALDKVSIFR